MSYSASTAAMAKAGEWQQALHLLHQVQVNLGMWELSSEVITSLFVHVSLHLLYKYILITMASIYVTGSRLHPTFKDAVVVGTRVPGKDSRRLSLLPLFVL